MNCITRSLVAVTLVSVPAVFAQKWEFGGGAGGGFYTSQTISSPAGSASAKFQNNLVGSVWFGSNNNGAWGGEIRYDYQRGDAELGSGGNKATFGAQSHAVHYDILLHFAPTEAAIRPYVAFGGGLKAFQGTGSEVAYQPLSNIGLLTKTTDTRPMISVGGGVKMKISRGLSLRVEAHDFLTPFPKNIIAPALNAKVGGWLQDIVATVGIGLVF